MALNRSAALAAIVVASLAASAGVARAQGYGPLPPPPPQGGGAAPAPASPYGPSPPPANLPPAAPQGDQGLVDESPPAPAPGAPAAWTTPEPEPLPEPEPARSGLLLGAAAGLGGVRLSGDLEDTRFVGFGFSLDVGWMFSERIAGIAEFWYSGGAHPDEDNVAGQVFDLGLAARYYFPVEGTLWAQAGLSITTFQLVGDREADAGGAELALGLGVELVRVGPVGLELRGKVGFGAVSNDAGVESSTRHGSVLLGVTWP